MSNILVSILVPVYNTSKYLEKCMDSLIKQTLREIEIICVNDGSTDNSLEILEEYAKKDPRVIIVNKPNGGLPSARNAGIDRATGEYLGFVDSDDYVEVTMFEKMYKTAKKNKAEVVICGAEIFPTTPAPTSWLYDVLSPRTCHYPEFTPDVLFKERGSRPFLWRNLVKRDLIERENIRLKEDIVLGEDQAFQFKVYPKAKGISFIADKLYHYCWYREGSIMNTETNKKFAQKLEKHSNLCMHVMSEVQKLESYAEMRKQILAWSVELLYDDFIKVAFKDRRKIAKRMTLNWNDFGYWMYHNTFAPHINDMFRYFYFIADSDASAEVDASIIVNLYNSKDYFLEFKESICAQTLKNIEIIFINNASDNETYLHLHKWLMSDHRVRIMNQAYAPVSYTFNEGLSMAAGKTVVFADAHDVLTSPTVLEEHFKALTEANADIVSASPLSAETLEATVASAKIYDFMFCREFLEANGLEFENYHLLTTRAYTARALTEAKTFAVAASENPLFRYRSLWHRDWLYLEEANNTLKGYCELLRLTSEKKMAREHLRVVDELNSDKVIQNILNATNPYLMNPEDCPKGENSQKETFLLLCELNRLIDTSLVTGPALGARKILGEFISRRHAFLSGVMKF